MQRQALTTFFTLVLGVFLFPSFVWGMNTDIVINEIAAYESPGCEWVEVYNKGKETVNMEGWKFWEQSVNHGLSVSALSTGQDWLIEPGEYALIAQNDANLFSGACGEEYALAARTVFDSSWGTLNESGEIIGIKDAEGNLVEYFTYSTAPDFSLERKDATLADYTVANWQEHASGHTFGMRNDASLPVALPTPPPVQPPAEPPPAEPPPPPPRPSAQRIVINEFVSDSNTGPREWVELYNAEDIAGDLSGWRVRDGVQEIALLSGAIAAKGFFVIDLSGSKLNNSGDAIFLESPTRGIRDRVFYGDWTDGEDADAKDNAPAPKKGNASARLVDGYDTDADANNFLETTTPTKGSANRIIAPPSPLQNKLEIQGQTHEQKIPSSEEKKVEPSRSEAEARTEPELGFGAVEERKEELKAEKKTTKKSAPGRPALTGIISVEPGVFGSQYFYIVFPVSSGSVSAGMQVYLHTKDFPKLSRGDRVRVTGVLGEAYGEARFKLSARTDIEILAREEELKPALLPLSDIPPAAVGGIVSVEGEVTEAKRSSLFLDDGNGEIRIAIRDATGIDGSAITAGDRLRIQGLLRRRGEDAWEILPRDEADIEHIGEASMAAGAAPVEEGSGGHGYTAVAAGGVVSFLLGLLARTRGAILLAGVQNIWKKKEPSTASTDEPQ